MVLRHRGDAFRVIYAVQIGAALWVIHAFKKKSKTGIKTPQMEVDLIRERLKRLKEALEYDSRRRYGPDPRQRQRVP